MDDEAFVLYLSGKVSLKVQSSTMDTEFGINLPARILYLKKRKKTRKLFYVSCGYDVDKSTFVVVVNGFIWQRPLSQTGGGMKSSAFLENCFSASSRYKSFGKPFAQPLR